MIPVWVNPFTRLYSEEKKLFRTEIITSKKINRTTVEVERNSVPLKVVQRSFEIYLRLQPGQLDLHLMLG